MALKTELLRVELDDELLLQRNVDLSALGQLMHEDAQGGRDDLKPGRNNGVNEVLLSLFEPQHLPGLLANINDVVLGNLEGRNVNLLAVDGGCEPDQHGTQRYPGGIPAG